ncbi:MAG: YbbR-like domain-containing protein [Intestinibacter bartlettii]|uniref:CdaR family protein n=1 Tax=Intestinibacter bartlettii TaxID=261299 RepID=UPI0039A15B16
MIERLHKNTKIKIISLLSAIVLWMYVMAVVDPEDTKLYENIPITITNLNEIKDLGLVVDPDDNLVTSVYIKGKLSDLQKISANNIDVYGTVSNPIEGQNQLYLRASVNDKVTTEFKSDTIVINLEKSIEEEKNITVNITGVYKDNVDKVDLDKTKVVVSGPRSSVDSVKYVQVTFDANKESVDTKSTELELKALDSEMNEVDHVTLEFNKVTAKVSYFQQKQVKINPIFSSNESNLVQDQDFTIIPSEINIKGKSDVINNIDSINTKMINVDELGTNNKIVDLDIPDGINADKDSVTIKLINKNKTKNSTFIYSGDDINLLNNEEDVSINDFEIPDDIIVKIQYDNDSDRISKNDLKLYLDLSEGIVSGTRYAITHNDINVKSITIEPSYITAK